MASTRAIAGAGSRIDANRRDARERAARVARPATRRARDDDAAESESVSEPGSRAHAGPHDVVVKRTTPRPTRAVARTGAVATKSAKAHRRQRAWAPDALEFHGLVRARREDLGTRANEDERERFPYGDGFAFARATCETETMVALATAMVGEERRMRLENVLEHRSFSLLPILEGVYDGGNILAVCRTTEALGIGCASIVSSKGLSFKASGRTSGGALKWQHVEQFETSERALRVAKAKGYRVLTTEFDGAQPLSHYDWTVPTAVVFGNEREGVSDEARALRDGAVYIPMFGFTESLNISVAAALVMSHAVTDRINRRGFHGDLTEEEKRILRGVYMSRLIPNYAKQGYLEELVERHRKGQKLAVTDDIDVSEETLDEIELLTELDAAKLVGRRKPKRDLGWDEHLDG